MIMRAFRECDLDLVSAAVDGELNDAERAGLDSHLAVCPECRDEYLEMWRASKLCSNLPMVSVPPDLTREIRQELVRKVASTKPQPTKESFWRGWFCTPQVRLSFASGICLLLLGFGAAWLYRPQRDVPISGYSLVAEADEEIAGLDLVIRYDPESSSLGKVGLSEISRGFLMKADTKNGTLRVSMACSKGMRLTRSEPILEIPIQFHGEVRRETLSLQSVRAYRIDGSEVLLNLETIPMPPASNGGKDTAA